MLIHPHVVHRIGDNDSDGTVAALLNCYNAGGAQEGSPPRGAPAPGPRNVRPVVGMCSRY